MSRISSLLLGAILVGGAAQAQQLVGIPPSLLENPQYSFLKGMKFQPELEAAIESDVRSGAPVSVILKRLRLDQLGSGALPTETITAKAPSLQGAPAAVQRRLRALARESDAAVNGAPALGGLLPDSTVKRLEGARQILYQVRPGINVATQVPNPVSPSTEAAADLASAWDKTAQIARPGINGTLTDCATPFDKLPQHCPQESDRQRCEHYDSRQFSQVIYLAKQTEPLCSGTYLGHGWILTAAHCFLENESAATHLIAWPTLQKSGDPYLDLQSEVNVPQIRVRLENVTAPDISPNISQVFIHPRWDPKQTQQDTPSLNDLALVYINASSTLDSAVQAAKLSTTPYNGHITTAGFGETTLSTLYQFGVTWPEADVKATNNRLLLGKPQFSTFCSGDSGGPAFEGLERGCVAPHPDVPLPRVLAGVVSYHGGSDVTTPSACQSSPLSAFTDVAVSENHSWICRTTNNTVPGCP